MLPKLRDQVVQLHAELPVMTSSAGRAGMCPRGPETGLVVIKASGIRYEEMDPEHMVVVDLEGRTMKGKLAPSSDTASHLHIYRHRPDVVGSSTPGRRALPRSLL